MRIICILILLIACGQSINPWDEKKEPESINPTNLLDEDIPLTWLQKGSFCNKLPAKRYNHGGLKSCRVDEPFTVEILSKKIQIYSEVELYESGELYSAYLVPGQKSVLSLPGEMFNNPRWYNGAFRLYKSGFLKEFRASPYGNLPKNFPYKNNKGEWRVTRRDINDYNPGYCRLDVNFEHCWRTTRIPAKFYESGWSREAYCLSGGVLIHNIYLEGNGCFLEVANKDWVRLYGLEKRYVFTSTQAGQDPVSIVPLQDLNGFPKEGIIACRYEEKECSYSLLASDGRYHDFFNGQEVEFDELGAVIIEKGE